MLRTILIFLFLIPYCALGVLSWPVLGIIYLFDKKAPRTFAFRFVRLACRIITFLSGTELTVSGLENIPEHAAFYIMNHRSLFDIVLTYPFMKRPTGFIAKNQLARVPVLAQWMRMAYSLFLDRDNIRQGMKTIQKAIDYLNNGISMCIFPEGTRNKADDFTDLLEFHTGSFHPAKKVNVPIIPVAIYNSADCFEKHVPFVKGCPVKIIFGKPIVLSELSEHDRRTISIYTQNIIQEMLHSCAAE